jgi:hypothetical protein
MKKILLPIRGIRMTGEEMKKVLRYAQDDSGPAGARGQDFPAAGLRASTLAPRTPYLRAVFSFVVPRKQSKRAVTRTSSKPRSRR